MCRIPARAADRPNGDRLGLRVAVVAGRGACRNVGLGPLAAGSSDRVVVIAELIEGVLGPDHAFAVACAAAREAGGFRDVSGFDAFGRTKIELAGCARRLCVRQREPHDTVNRLADPFATELVRWCV